MVMAEAIRWRYSRIPVGHLRIMHPSLGKAVRPAGGRMGDEKPTLVDAEREIPAAVKMLMVS